MNSALAYIFETARRAVLFCMVAAIIMAIMIFAMTAGYTDVLPAGKIVSIHVGIAVCLPIILYAYEALMQYFSVWEVRCLSLK